MLTKKNKIWKLEKYGNFYIFYRVNFSPFFFLLDVFFSSARTFDAEKEFFCVEQYRTKSNTLPNMEQFVWVGEVQKRDSHRIKSMLNMSSNNKSSERGFFASHESCKVSKVHIQLSYLHMLYFAFSHSREWAQLPQVNAANCRLYYYQVERAFGFK